MWSWKPDRGPERKRWKPRPGAPRQVCQYSTHHFSDLHRSGRGVESCRALLGEHGPAGSMGRRGNPYDNTMMESFMKMLKVAGGYPPMVSESTEDVAERGPTPISGQL